MNAGMRVRLERGGEEGTWVVADAEFAYGGVAAKAVMAKQVAAALIGKVRGVRMWLRGVTCDVV